MERLLSFLFENKEWIFSGIGVTLLAWLGALIHRALLRNKTHRSEKTQSPRPPSLAVGPRLVTLPTGESIDPDGITGITIKGDDFYNVSSFAHFTIA